MHIISKITIITALISLPLTTTFATFKTKQITDTNSQTPGNIELAEESSPSTKEQVRYYYKNSLNKTITIMCPNSINVVIQNGSTATCYNMDEKPTTLTVGYQRKQYGPFPCNTESSSSLTYNLSTSGNCIAPKELW